MTSKEFGRLFDTEAVPVLQSKFPALQVSYLECPGDSLDSTDMNPEHWCIIVDLILPKFCDYDAFLVLHGTDTMAYSAAALSFLFTAINKEGHRDAILNKPIVLTGSQLPLFDGDSSSAQLLFNTDAFQNLCGAVECIYRGIPKVCLFFNNKLFLGTRAKKTSSNQFDAFLSPNHPPLVQIGIELSLDHAKIRPDIRKRTVLLSSSSEARERLQSQTKFMKEHLPSV
jgi:L-asparaginase